MSLRTIAYVSHADSREVCAIALTRGRLELLQRARVPGPVMPLAISPDRRFLYAALRVEPNAVVSFRIDPETGLLHEIGQAPLPDSFPAIATDRTGRFLLGASYSGNCIAILPISPQGFVQPARQVRPTPPKAHAILPDPKNRNLYVPCLGGDIILRLPFDAARGGVEWLDSPGVQTAAGAGPRHMRFHPNGDFLYCVNELDGTVASFRRGEMGSHPVALAVYDAKPPGLSDNPAAAEIQLTPDGRFLYASIRGSHTLAAFAVSERGELQLLGHIPTEKTPRGFAICPRGKFLLAAGQDSHHVALSAIREDGLLEPIERREFGRNPNWVEIVELP